MSIGLKKNFAVFALSALAAGAVAIACGGGGGGGSNGGAGGDSGGAGGDGGGGGDAAGKGGAATGGKGSGGGGSGGSGNGGSGNGGSGNGGSGTGGSSNGGSGGGATGGMGGTVVSNKAFCMPQNFSPRSKDGISLPLAPGSAPGAGAPKGTMTTVEAKEGSTIITVDVFVPFQYEAAKEGDVAIMFLSSKETLGSEKVIGDIEKLIQAGMMPPTLVVYGGVAWGDPSNAGGANVKSRAATLVNVLFPAIKAKYAKVSANPKMHAVGGQSTSGAVAFDIAYATPDFFGKVWGASSSFANFMNWLFPYPEKITAVAKDKIRVSLAVGECDLVPNVTEVPPNCVTTCAGTACLDGAIANNWKEQNTAVAQKLISLGYATRLMVKAKGQHLAFGASSADDLTWLWRDVVCP